jgi:single-stranded DNA-binding protein
MNNQLTIVGRVGQAPKAVSFGDTGNKVVKFSLGVTEYRNNEESTLWIDVDAWNGLGERVLATVTKGRELVLVGRLAINKYDKEVDGVKVEVQKPVLKLSSFHLCGPKPASKEKEAAAAGAA